MTEYEKLLSKTKVNSSAGVGISQENVNKRNKAQTAKSTAAKTKTVPTIKALGASDYGAGKDHVVKAGAYSTASSLANIRGQLLAPTGDLTMGQSAQAAIKGVSQSSAEKEKYNRQAVTQKKAYGAADSLAQRSAEEVAKAKAGKGKFGQTMVDVGVAGTQMLGDLALNAIVPGSGLAAMGARAYGSSSLEARQAGANALQQVGYGLASAGVEVLTEKMFNGLAGVYGKGAADEVVNKLVGKLTKSPAGMTALRVLANASGEGIEEVASDIANPWIKSIYDKGDALKTKFGSGEGFINALSDEGHDFVVGGVLGLLGGGTQVLNGQSKVLNAEARQANGYASEKAMTPQEQAAYNKVLALNPQTGKAKPASVTELLAGVNRTPLAANQPNGASRATTPQNAAETVFVSENVIPPTAAENSPQSAQQAAESAQNEVTPQPSNYTAEVENAPTVGQTQPDEPQAVTDPSHIDRRDYDSVKNRSVNAFQYDHPEVHKYYQDPAMNVAQNVGTAMMYGASTYGGYGNDAITRGFRGALGSNSFEDGIKALENIYNDQGQENYALAKRMEIFLDGLLTDGYSIGRTTYAPNADYIAAKDSIGGGDTAWDRYFNQHQLELLEGATEDELRANFEKETAQGDGLGAADKGFAGDTQDFQDLQAQGGATHDVSAQQAANVQEQQGREAVNVPKRDFNGRLTSKHAQTLINSGVTTENVAYSIESAIANGKMSYDAYSDDAAIANAEAQVEKSGWDAAYGEWKANIQNGKASKDISTMGITLYNNAVTSGDTYAAMDIVSLMAQNSRNVAQAQQALSILNKLTPEGRLYAVQQSAENIQQRLIDKMGVKAPNIEIDEGVLKAYQDALNSGDKTAIDKALAEVQKNIASQIPSSWVEKLNAWRYLAMLGNPRTHVRNIIGNAGFMPVRMMKNCIAASMERVYYGKAGENSGRTKAALNLMSADDRQLFQVAWSEYGEVEDLIQSGGKFNDNASKINDMKTVFNIKPLEAVRKANNYALDKEDTWFSRPAYAESLASYLKANGISASDYADGYISAETKNKAQTYAIKEAQKATYRDTNLFSEIISKAGKSKSKVLNTLVEGVLPFKKTPANILARAVEYSPIELVKAISHDAFQVKTGNMQASEMIDHLASGLTGTGLMALGGLLASLGVLSGGSSGDDKKDNFDKLQGQQQYALTVGDKNYTLDWLAPEALPLFCGVELFNSFIDNGAQAKDFYTSMTRLASPIVEMSMLQGVNDMIDNVSYADSSGKLWAMASSAVTGYLSQYIPTLGGQIERSIESQRYSTYTDPNSALPKDWQYAIAKAANKIPGVEYGQIPYVDAWGRTQDTGSVAERLFGNFLSPAYSSKNNTAALDTELQRLYDAGQTNVLPQRAATSVKVNDEYLSGDEYEKYQATKGKTSYDILKNIISDSSYKSMSDEGKASTVSDAYKYANAVAAKTVADKRGEGYSSKTWDKYITAEKEQGIDWWTYYQFRHPADVDNSGTKTNADYYAAIKSLAGLSNSQKNYMRKVVKGK